MSTFADEMMADGPWPELLRVHGRSIVYEPPDAGGSSFTFTGIFLDQGDELEDTERGRSRLSGAEITAPLDAAESVSIRGVFIVDGVRWRIDRKAQTTGQFIRFSVTRRVRTEESRPAYSERT